MLAKIIHLTGVNAKGAYSTYGVEERSRYYCDARGRFDQMPSAGDLWACKQSGSANFWRSLLRGILNLTSLMWQKFYSKNPIITATIANKTIMAQPMRKIDIVNLKTNFSNIQMMATTIAIMIIVTNGSILISLS